MVDPIAIKVGGERSVPRVAVIAAAAPVAPAQPVATPKPPIVDAVALSGVAAELASKPPVDENRVAMIKRAVAEGTFPILPATIADRLLALRYDWMRNEPA